VTEIRLPGNTDGLITVAEIHDLEQGRSYLLALDAARTDWNWGGSELLTAVIDHTTGTVTDRKEHGFSAFAQLWLVQQGCPADDLATLTSVGSGLLRPADAEARRIEAVIRSSGTRYEVLDTAWQVDDEDRDYAENHQWVLTRDTEATRLPVRLFLQTEDLATHRYTLRVGAYRDVEDARQAMVEGHLALPAPEPEPLEDAAQRSRYTTLGRLRPATGPGTVPPPPAAPPRKPTR
jgi:hypothetical protein